MKLYEALAHLKEDGSNCLIRNISHIWLKVTKTIHPHDEKECIIFEKRISGAWIPVTEPCIPLDNWELHQDHKCKIGDLVRGVVDVTKASTGESTLKEKYGPVVEFFNGLYFLEGHVLGFKEENVTLIMTKEELDKLKEAGNE